MGIFDFFRRRREAESALSSPEQQAAIEQAMAQAEAWQQAGGAPGTPVGQPPVEGVGVLAGLGTLISQLQAAQQAGVTVESSSHVVDMRGTGLREEILGVIAAHGIDPSEQREVDGNDADGLQRDILAVLARNGIDVNAAAMGMPFAIVEGESKQPEQPVDPEAPQIRNPLRP